MYASSSAWVGCSWVPSPAFTTLPRIQCDSRCGAPLAQCRHTTASLPIASRVSAVSLSDSPLLTLEPLAEKLMTSADSRLAATSNEVRVRVESSKNRLTTVRPRSVGSFLMLRPTSAASMSAAVSRTSSASSRVRSPAESRWRFIEASSALAAVCVAAQVGRPEQHAVAPVVVGELDVHGLDERGREVLADVVGADRQLPMAAVDEHRELDGPRPAEVGQRVERGPNGPAGEQHVVDEDDGLAVDAAGGTSVSSSARTSAAAGRRGTS